MACYKVVAMALILVMSLMVLLPTIASASDLVGAALKIFGIGYAVKKFGPQINKFINNLAGQKGINWDGTTKVVPIISIGQGGHIGAAQVQGPPDRVQTVKAVGQLETRLGGLRGKLLLPVNTSNPTARVTAVKGVGVSALIDFKI